MVIGEQSGLQCIVMYSFMASFVKLLNNNFLCRNMTLLIVD